VLAVQPALGALHAGRRPLRGGNIGYADIAGGRGRGVMRRRRVFQVNDRPLKEAAFR
jgi:hypothetical protein